MRKRMNNDARSDGWQTEAAKWLRSIWKLHDAEGYVFIGTKNAETGKWTDHSFRLPVSKNKLVRFFRKHPRELFDLYACANPFETDRRKSEYARQTPYACVDVDDAPVAAFLPPPTISWETSPGRTQGIWVHNRLLDVKHAEQIAKDLAYTYGADKNGWSVTKYLRVPFTYNHKPEYDRPEVRLLTDVADPLACALEPAKFVVAPAKTKRKAKVEPRSRSWQSRKKLPQGRKHRQQILEKYRSKLSLMPRTLLGHDTLLYPDRSDAIFAMVAGLYKAGASRCEIDIAIWNSVYFIDKYGHDRNRLEEEISRILGKLEGI